MQAPRNQRIYLVLDPDEAAALHRVIRQTIPIGEESRMDPKKKAILDRLNAAVKRAREKGAKFT